MSTERTENDTWDLATSVGATATMVAAGRARATKAALIEDRFAEPLVRAVGVDFFTRWATGELAAADVDVPGAPWGMQRMTDLLAARTQYFDKFLNDAVGKCIRQVVILASGLDARGYRLSWPAGTVVFEIDQPAVLAFKAATLGELKAAPTADVRAVPIDLRHDWPAALHDAGFGTGKPTAWIAEGLQRRREPPGFGGCTERSRQRSDARIGRAQRCRRLSGAAGLAVGENVGPSAARRRRHAADSAGRRRGDHRQQLLLRVGQEHGLSRTMRPSPFRGGPLWRDYQGVRLSTCQMPWWLCQPGFASGAGLALTLGA